MSPAWARSLEDGSEYLAYCLGESTQILINPRVDHQDLGPASKCVMPVVFLKQDHGLAIPLGWIQAKRQKNNLPDHGTKRWQTYPTGECLQFAIEAQSFFGGYLITGLSNYLEQPFHVRSQPALLFL